MPTTSFVSDVYEKPKLPRDNCLKQAHFVSSPRAHLSCAPCIHPRDSLATLTCVDIVSPPRIMSSCGARVLASSWETVN